jgi:hypothetical protein
MFFRKRKPDPTINEDEFEDVVSRLRAERREATPLELDQIKMRALNQAHRSASGPRARGVDVRRTLIVLISTFSLMAAGTGAVIADNDNGKSKGDDGKDKGDKEKKDKDKGDKNAGKSQYSQCKNSNGGASNTSSKNQSSQQANCPPPPPNSQGSHGNGSHQSHQNQGSHGNDD